MQHSSYDPGGHLAGKVTPRQIQGVHRQIWFCGYTIHMVIELITGDMTIHPRLWLQIEMILLRLNLELLVPCYRGFEEELWLRRTHWKNTHAVSTERPHDLHSILLDAQTSHSDFVHDTLLIIPVDANFFIWWSIMWTCDHTPPSAPHVRASEKHRVSVTLSLLLPVPLLRRLCPMWLIAWTCTATESLWVFVLGLLPSTFLQLGNGTARIIVATRWCC